MVLLSVALSQSAYDVSFLLVGAAQRDVGACVLRLRSLGYKGGPMGEASFFGGSVSPILTHTMRP